MVPNAAVALVRFLELSTCILQQNYTDFDKKEFIKIHQMLIESKKFFKNLDFSSFVINERRNPKQI